VLTVEFYFFGGLGVYDVYICMQNLMCCILHLTDRNGDDSYCYSYSQNSDIYDGQ